MNETGKNRPRKERLKLLRKTKLLSAAKMGEIMEISEDTYYWYENLNNDNFPNERKIKKLIDKLGVRKEWLLEGKEPMFDGQSLPIVQEIESFTQSFELRVDPKATKITITLLRG